MPYAKIKDGISNARSARYMRVSRRSVNDWVKRFKQEGIDGLKKAALRATHYQMNNYRLRSYVLDNSIKPSDGWLKVSFYFVNTSRHRRTIELFTHIHRLIVKPDLNIVTGKQHYRRIRSVTPLGSDNSISHECGVRTQLKLLLVAE